MSDESESNLVNISSFLKNPKVIEESKGFVEDMFNPVDSVLDAIEENGGYGIAVSLDETRGLVVASSFQLNHDDIISLLESALAFIKEEH